MKVERLKISDFDSDLVCGFLDWLETGRGCSISTRNQRLTALHSFFRYLQKQSPPDMEAIQGILDILYKKTATTIVPYLNEGQMQALLSVPDGSCRQGFRDQVLLSLLYDTGARVQELADLKIKDIRIESPSVVSRAGKGERASGYRFSSDTACIPPQQSCPYGQGRDKLYLHTRFPRTCRLFNDRDLCTDQYRAEAKSDRKSM